MDRGSKPSATPSSPPRSIRPPRALSRIEEEERERSSSDSSLLASSHSRKFWFASSSLSSSRGGNVGPSVVAVPELKKRQEENETSSPRRITQGTDESEMQKAYGREKQTKPTKPTTATSTLNPNPLTSATSTVPEKSSSSPRAFGRWLRKSIVSSPPSPPPLLSSNASSESRQDDGSRKTDASSCSPTKSKSTSRSTTNVPTNRGDTYEEGGSVINLDLLSLSELDQLNKSLESQCETLEGTIERSRQDAEMYKMQTSIDLSTYKSMVSRAQTERQKLETQCAELETELEQLRMKNFDTQKDIMSLEENMSHQDRNHQIVSEELLGTQ